MHHPTTNLIEKPKRDLYCSLLTGSEAFARLAVILSNPKHVVPRVLGFCQIRNEDLERGI